MSDHGINVTYKAGSGYDEFWITVGGDDPQTWIARNDAVRTVIGEAAANTAQMIRSLNKVARELGGVGVSNEQPAAVPSPAAAPAQQVVAPTPEPQAAAPASPPLSVVEGDFPAGVRIWQGPNPERPQYTELFIDYEYNQAFSNALKAGMEAAGQKLFWNKTAKARTTNPRNEALLRSLVVQNKQLLGA